MTDKIVVSNVSMKNKGSLILQCDVELVPWNLVFKEVRYFEKGQNYWIGMPCRSWKDDDEQWCYKELVQFKDTEIKEKFRKSICDKIREAIENGVDETPIMDEEIPF